jgi:casein kinase II subunit alpha
LAGLIFKAEPFFYGTDLLDQVTAVASVVGSKALLEWTEKCNLQLTALQRKAIGNFSAVPLDRFCNDGNSHLSCPEAIDLLRGMLCVDHQLRATVESCLAHPFFDPVRGT